MSAHVVVIGAGLAGTAAAFAAKSAGARVTVVGARPGATSLTSGAVDAGTARPFGDDRARVLAFFEALSLWEVGTGLCLVGTRAGLLREARGRDRSVLDLARVAAGQIAVVDAGRGDIDAGSLARGWTHDPWAIERGLTFRAVRVDVLRLADEARLPEVDLAERYDDAERVLWLADRLRESPDIVGKTAVVLGPWLGLRRGAAQELASALGVPVGEPLSTPGGVAGVRFEIARDALLGKHAIERIAGWASGVSATRGVGVRVDLTSGAIEADAVVLATGGLAGGGIAWKSGASGPTGFALTIEAPSLMALGGEPLSPSGSPGGALFEPFAWSGHRLPAGFERVGIWTDERGSVLDHAGNATDWLYAAGDVTSGAPRTLLEAIRSGTAVGVLAAAKALSSSA